MKNKIPLPFLSNFLPFLNFLSTIFFLKPFFLETAFLLSLFLLFPSEKSTLKFPPLSKKEDSISSMKTKMFLFPTWNIPLQGFYYFNFILFFITIFFPKEKLGKKSLQYFEWRRRRDFF